jgi:hypothetical protein
VPCLICRDFSAIEPRSRPAYTTVTGDSARRGYDGRMRRAWVFALLALSGCYSKATAYDGKFTLAYPSMVEHDNFVKPIAPGAKLEVNVFANGTTTQLEVLGAKSSRPDVVDIATTKTKSVVLVGKAAGVAEIEIRAKNEDGTELVDKMFFHVAKPAKHALGHWCTEDPDAAYVVGEEVLIHHGMKTADGRSVIGFDYAPFTVEPRGALELREQPQAGGYYELRAKSAKAKVTIRSKVDDQTLTMRLVDRKDLTDAVLYAPERMLVGQSSYVVASVTLGDTPVCNQNALTKAKSLTPEICKVTAKLDEDPDEGDSNRDQLARINALAFGVCKYEVVLPDLAKGKGVVLKGEVKVGREEYPGERGTADRVRAYLDEWSRPLGTIASAKEALALVGLVLLALRRKISRE